MAVAVQPIIQKCLIEVRGDDLLAKLVRLGADEGQAQSGEHGDQRLRDAVGIRAAVGIFGLDLGQRGGDHEQAMRALGHASQAVDENFPVGGEGLDQVGEIFALDDAGVLHAADRVVAERQGAFFDVRKPLPKAAEGERILLARVDNRDGKRRAKLRASAVSDHRQERRRDRSGGRGPRERGRIRVRLRGMGFQLSCIALASDVGRDAPTRAAETAALLKLLLEVRELGFQLPLFFGALAGGKKLRASCSWLCCA